MSRLFFICAHYILKKRESQCLGMPQGLRHPVYRGGVLCENIQKGQGTDSVTIITWFTDIWNLYDLSDH